MGRIFFATGNAKKYEYAKSVCDTYGIDLIQQHVDIEEIQSEDPQKIALDKAQKAFKAIGQPIVITDDSWAITGLKGFPGPYMHSVNLWLTPEDFLRLTLPLKNRQVIHTQRLVYVDGAGQKLFTQVNKGQLLKEIKGESKHANHTIITFGDAGGASLAEVEKNDDKAGQVYARTWYKFGRWYSNSHSSDRLSYLV